jgi:hypothetical protein
MMKKTTIFPFLILIIPVLAVLSACNEKEEVYVSNLEFSVIVPVEWLYEEDINDSIRYYAVSPYRPNDVTSGSDTVSEDVIIIRDYYPGTLEDFYVSTQYYYKYLLDSYDSLSTEELVINGYDFIKHVDLESVWLPSRVDPDTDIEIELQVVRYFVLHDGYGYVISCAATPDTWNYYNPVFTTIVGTFVFKE